METVFTENEKYLMKRQDAFQEDQKLRLDAFVENMTKVVSTLQDYSNIEASRDKRNEKLEEKRIWLGLVSSMITSEEFRVEKVSELADEFIAEMYSRYPK